MNKTKIMISALSKFLLVLILVSLILFLPAGTFHYIDGWIFIALLFIPMTFLGIVLFIKAPELLEKRLSTKEKEKTQQIVVKLSALLFLVGFIIAGLDFRFHWSTVPTWCKILASLILLISYGLYAEVMRENTYLSRTVEVQENQKVVDTGLYGIVRHPMYAVTIWLFLSIPVILGSWLSLVCFLYYPILIISRIQNEEKILENGLDGYKEYKTKVRWRLIPFIW